MEKYCKKELIIKRQQKFKTEATISSFFPFVVLFRLSSRLSNDLVSHIKIYVILKCMSQFECILATFFIIFFFEKRIKNEFTIGRQCEKIWSM